MVFLFVLEYTLQNIYPEVFFSARISVIDPIYPVRLFIIFYVLVSLRYSFLKFCEISNCIIERHEKEPKLKENFTKTFRRIKALLGNTKIHILLLIVGFSLYFLLTYSFLNRFQ